MTGTTGPSAAPGRVDAIDFIKGALVGFMVVYHTLNYSAWRAAPGLYMAFLPPSFILITGFLLTSIYAHKYRLDGREIGRRLLIRGLRLILLFAVLNVAGNALLARNYDGGQLGLDRFVRELPHTFLIGGTGTASFEILLPIGYLLLAAPWLLRAQAAALHFLSIFSAVALLACAWLEHAGHAWGIASLFTVGVIGMAAGLVPMAQWTALARRWPYLIGAYALYWVLRAPLGQIYLMQAFAACVTVLLLYVGARPLDPAVRWVGEINRLGRYSLLSYIAQIAVLQGLHRTVRFEATSPFAVACMGGLTLLGTWGAVVLTEWLRRRVAAVDRLYRVVLG
jgi:hypothetical protein